jgi:protein TonB
VASSTVQLDTDFITPELKWYIEIVRRKVWQNWIEPAHVVPAGYNARVVIRFELGRNGEFISEPVVLKSSHVSLFDQSGYRAVIRAAPFPPLPDGYTGERLGVQFGFEYGERT